MRRKILKIIGIILLVGIVAFLIIFASISSESKKHQTENLDFGVVFNESGGAINLEEFETNVTIKKAGSYIISGSFDNSLIVDADGEVTLILNNAEIRSTRSAAIINLSDNPLKLALVEETANTFFGGSNKKYSSVIYSVGTLEISGSTGGILLMTRYSDGTPIIGEHGVKVNSGIVVETARDGEVFNNTDFSQGKLVFELNKEVASGSEIMIMDSKGEVVSQFNGESEFKKIGISSEYIENKKYFIYINGELITSGVGENKK